MTLRAGAARVEFTPEPGVWMHGWGQHPNDDGVCDVYERGYVPRLEPARGTLDPLHARAVAVADDETCVIVLALDTLEIPAEFTRRMRAEISAATGIPPGNILVNVSHTHAAPDWSRGTHTIPAPVTDRILDAGIEASTAAHATLRPARYGYSTGHCDAIAINRRDPTGPIDDEVGILKLVDDEGDLIAAVVKYACHPIVLQGSNLYYSADYPGVTCAILERVFPGSTIAFVQGTAGDINPTAFLRPPKRDLFIAQKAAVVAGGTQPASIETMRAIGSTLAAEALRVLAHTPTCAHATLSAAHSNVQLNLKPREDREIYCRFLTIPDAARVRLLEADVWSTEVQALRIGALHIVALEGEPFVEFGLGLRSERPEMLMVLGYSNGTISYLPTDVAQMEQRYENVASVVAIGSQAVVEAAAHQVLDEVARSRSRLDAEPERV